MFLLALKSDGCPRSCRCSNHIFKCRNAGLRKIPEDVSLSVRYIDISNNALLIIERRELLKFKQLEILILENCLLHGPIDLPRTLRTLNLNHNLMTINSLNIMFKPQIKSLLSINLISNQLNLTELFPILPRNVEYLELSYNSLQSLKRKDMQCCTKLKQFICGNCGIKSIEPNALDSSRELSKFMIDHNEIAHLPADLFQYNKKLADIDLYANQLQNFNSSAVQLCDLITLELGYNKISSFDVRSIKIVSFGIGNNKLTELTDWSFSSMKYVQNIYLQNNKIWKVSDKTFYNVKFISELVMFNNSIKALPKYVFKGTEISKIFLQHNRLKNLSGVLLGMKRTPSVLLLSSNNELTNLITADFQSMRQESEIFITCKNLQRIIGNSATKAEIKCSPSTDVVFRTSSRFFGFYGYDCKWRNFEFHCRACPAGYYGTGSRKEREMGRCIMCPSGGFYQDTVANLDCKHCPMGQYVPPDFGPGKDVSDCRTCPDGTNTKALAGTRACRCLDGFYRTYRFGPCRKCTEKGFKCQHDYPLLRMGYWMTWNITDLNEGNYSCRESFTKFVLNLKTIGSTYDRKTVRFNCKLPLPIKCPLLAACEGGMNSSCSPGYTGALCAECSKGYSRRFNRCVKCPERFVIVLEFIAHLTIFGALCFVIISAANKNERKQLDSEINRTLSDMLISSFKILISFYQVLLSILLTFNNVGWSSSVLKAITILQYIQCELIKFPSFRCISPDWDMNAVREFWIVLIITLVVPVIGLVCFFSKSLYFYTHEVYASDFKRKRNLYCRNCIKVMALFLYISYPLISSRIFQILPFNCHKFCILREQGTCLQSMSYLRSDYSISCASMAKKELTVIAGFCSLIIPFGLPLVLLLMLRFSLQAKHSSVPEVGSSYVNVTNTIANFGYESDDYQEETQDVTHCVYTISDNGSNGKTPIMKYAIRFTYENFTDNCWYWEVIEVIRKLIMIIGCVLSLGHTKVGLSSLVILSIAFALLHAIKKPCRDGFENYVQLLSYLIVPINLSFAAILQSTATDYHYTIAKEMDTSVTEILFMLINFLLPVLLVGRFIREFLRRVVSCGQRNVAY